jgi:hypothetical protein
MNNIERMAGLCSPQTKINKMKGVGSMKVLK